MKRRGFTLIELLVVIAIIGVLLALLLAAIQRVREAAARLRCQNNLKQIALAAHSYHDAFNRFPPGATPPPSEASGLALLLPFLEQGNLYRQFDFSKSVFSDPVNAAARGQQIPTFLCPSDTSQGYYQDPFPPGTIAGGSNYFANLGAHGWWMDQAASSLKIKPATLRGVFALNSRTRISDITDGCSNTLLFAEVKRGADPGHDELDVTVLLPPSWDNKPYNAATNPSNLAPPLPCDTPSMTRNDTGLVYCRGFLTTAFYTHTVPPNYRGRDCIRGLTFDQGHVAARSYHPGGVNVAFADGSVRFIRDSIPFETWQKLGTRCGGETIDTNDY